MYLNDGHKSRDRHKNGERRRRIGDSKLEISILVKKRKKQPKLMKPPQHPGMMPNQPYNPMHGQMGRGQPFNRGGFQGGQQSRSLSS